MMKCERLRKYAPQLGICLLTLLSLTSATGFGQTLNFDLEDYAQLGNINLAIEDAYQRIQSVSNSPDAHINYSSLITAYAGDFSSHATSTGGRIVNYLTDVNSLINATGEEGPVIGSEFEEVAAALSPANLDDIRVTLSNIRNQAAALESQLPPEIPLPDPSWATAAIVSARARADLVNYRQEMVDAAASLSQSGIDLLDRLAELDQLRSNVSASENASYRAAELLATHGLQGLATSFGFLAIDLQSIARTHISPVRTAMDRLIPTVSDRVDEMNEFIDLVDEVLAHDTLRSNWSTSARFGPTPTFELSFESNEFTHTATEIDGPFTVGALRIQNVVSFGVNFSSTPVTFEVVRTVDDPSLGTQITRGTASATILYVATPNTPDDPIASQDLFVIPELGLSGWIVENTATKGLEVLGQYSSPLRIVEVRPLGDEAGIIMNSPTYGRPLLLGYRLNYDGVVLDIDPESGEADRSGLIWTKEAGRRYVSSMEYSEADRTVFAWVMNSVLTGTGQLARVDVVTGEAKLVGEDPQGHWMMVGLTSDEDGRLFGFDQEMGMVSIDAQTGAASLLWSDIRNVVDADFGPDGVLYATEGGSELFTLDVATGELSILYDLAASSNVVSLENLQFSPSGDLLGAGRVMGESEDQALSIFDIDFQAGVVSNIRPLGNYSLNSLLFVPPQSIPEPSSFALLALGLSVIYYPRPRARSNQ
jgi:hypothetical protein